MARPAIILLLPLLGLASGAAGATPAGYSCDCASRDNCACPTNAPPGRLAPKDTPQFILFTHDDAILPLTDRAFRDVCDGRRNPDGCPFRATMFTQAANTDCQLAKRMWQDGYEIATHTANHIAMPAGFPANDTVAEILGAKRFLADECGIPAEEIRGFRSPYLKTNPVVRQVLHENGFLFDSTLLEAVNSESLSTSMADRTWPYTLDFGIAQNCDWFRDTQQCDAAERWPGLWEVPLWVLSVLDLEFTMDVGYYGGRGVYEPLMSAFESAYEGNRAPLPIYVHTTWVEKDPSRLQELQQFADYTLTKPDVFWVTMSQLIAWIKNPVPASQLRASGGAMCQQSPAAASPVQAPLPALPRSGANVTLSLAATPAQVADQRRRLEAAVGELLGLAPRATSPFVAELVVVVPPYGGGAVGATSVDDTSLAVQSDASQPGGTPLDGWLQFEGPSYTSSYSIQSTPPEAALSGEGSQGGSAVQAQNLGGSAARGSSVRVQVTLAAAGPDPLALYQQASKPARRAALDEKLSAMGLEPAGKPSVIPIKDGLAMALAAPPPAQQPTAQPAPSNGGAAASQTPAQAGATEGGAAAAAAPSAARPETAAAAAASGAAGSSTNGGGSSAGLSTGAIVGIAAAGAVAAAAVAAAGLVFWRRRRAGRAADAGGAGTVGAAREELPGGNAKAGAPSGSVTIAVNAA